MVMGGSHDRLTDHDEDEATAWSAPRPSPGAMGAAHDDLFGVPTAAPPEPEPEPDSEDDEADVSIETDVEGDADGDDDDERSVGAEETDVEGRSGATAPDGDGSRTAV